jgi:hypothetical protein
MDDGRHYFLRFFPAHSNIGVVLHALTDMDGLGSRLAFLH